MCFSTRLSRAVARSMRMKLAAGPLAAELQNGQMRYIAFNGVEALDSLRCPLEGAGLNLDAFAAAGVEADNTQAQGRRA